MAPYVLIGMILGLLVGSLTDGFGPTLLYCGLIGGLGGWVLHLSSRIKELETAREADAPVGRRAQPDPASGKPEATPSSATLVAREAAAMDTARPPGPPPSRSETDDDVWAPAPARAEPEQESGPSAVDRAIAAAKNWFTTGNVPVKVGVVVVLFGVGFFIKYAIDHQLFTFPVWARLAGLAVLGFVMLGVG